MDFIGADRGLMLSRTWTTQPDETRINNLYRGLSRIMLSLARIPQSCIGSLRFNDDDWQDDLEDFLHQFQPLHKRFVATISTCENEEIDAGRLPASERLSSRMNTSLQDGTFWFYLAATSSDRFDEIFWKYLDPVYFGPFDTIEGRSALLGPDAKKTLDDFVKFKLVQAQSETLDEHRTMDEILV